MSARRPRATRSPRALAAGGPHQEPAGASRQADAVLWIAVAGLVAGMALSWRLWSGAGRTFPEAPVFGWLARAPAWTDPVLAVGMLALVIGAAANRRHRRPLLAGALACGLALAVLDEVRWQPWFYLYGLIILALAPSAARVNGPGEPDLNAARWVLVATYLWSGFHKCNSGFLHFYEHGIVAKLDPAPPGIMAKVVDLGAYLAGALELVIGLLLVLPVTRRAGSVLAVGLHLSILVLLGPLFGGRNSVIWPWNLAMAALVVVLFWQFRGRLFELPRAGRRRWVAVAIGVAVFALPALSLVHAWPQYLSFHLYSGQGQRLQLVLHPAGAAKLPHEIQAVTIPSPVSDQLRVIDFLAWSMEDLNVPASGDAPLLLKLGQELDRRLGLGDADGFFYHDFPNYLEKRGWNQYRPSEFRRLTELPPPGGGRARRPGEPTG